MSFKKKLLKELEGIYKECSQEGWDGYDAEIISGEVKEAAEFFVNSLPDDPDNYEPLPYIAPMATGEICFEWRFNESLGFLFSVSKERTISFSGVFCGEKKLEKEECLEILKTMENFRKLSNPAK